MTGSGCSQTQSALCRRVWGRLKGLYNSDQAGKLSNWARWVTPRVHFQIWPGCYNRKGNLITTTERGGITLKFETISIAAIIVLAIVAAGIATYYLLTPPRAGAQTTTYSFIEQPVVDVIIPTLFREQGSNNGNIPLNVTRGESISLAVDVYSTVSLAFEMQFRIFALASEQGSNSSVSSTSNASTSVVAIFSPETLTISGAGETSSNMTLAVSARAPMGEYNSVVSVMNLNNSSQVWGSIVQISITG